MSKLLAAAGADGESQSLSEKYGVDHFDTLTGFGITFEKSKKYKEVADMADVDIVKMPGQTALDLEDMIRRGGLLIPDAEENFFQKEGFDPIARYDDIYLIGTYLSACINSNLANDVYFPHITRLAETLEDWFSKILDEDLQKNSELVNRMRQALPILFFNLYYIFKKNGDTTSAAKWINSAQVASYRLGTRQFAFYTISEKARLIAEAIVFSDDLTIFDTDQFTDVITEMQRMEDLANVWYKNLMVKKGVDPVLEKRIIKNQNKSILARLGYEGARLLGKKGNMVSMELTLKNKGIQIVEILEPDNAQKLQSLIAYEKKVRVIKGEFIKFYNNRNTETFENTDMHMIVLCEMMIAKIARRLRDSSVSDQELLPVQSYLDPGFWKPVEDIPESSREPDGGHPDQHDQSMERSIMHMNPDLDQRYHRMSVFNLLINEGAIQIESGGNFNPLGRILLGQIARDIAGVNPYVSATISRYFIDAQDYPVVKEFLENIAKLGKIEVEGNEMGNAVLYDDIMIDGSRYGITTVGKYMQRLLIGPSRHDDISNYFDSNYGHDQWFLEYAHAPNATEGSKKKIMEIGNLALKVESDLISKIVIEGSDGENITIYHSNPTKVAIDLTTKRRLDRLFIPLRRMSEGSRDISTDRTDPSKERRDDLVPLSKHERNKKKITQLCMEIHGFVNHTEPSALNVDMMASLDMIGITSDERASFAVTLYRILGSDIVRATIRNLQKGLSLSGSSISRELAHIDVEISESQNMLNLISTGNYSIPGSESLKSGYQRGLKEILREKMSIKMGKLLELRKYLIE